MRVMVLGLRGFPEVQGGVERHSEYLYPLLAESKCKIDVIVRSPYVSHNIRSWNGVTFHRIWAPTTRISGVEAFVHTLLGVLYAGIMRPDILHIHAIGPAMFTPLARLIGLRVVVTHHGPDFDREKWGKFASWLLRMGEKWGMLYANQRIVISNVIRQLVIDMYGLDSVVIPNGVALPVIPESMDTLYKFSLVPRKYILLVSRFVPEKRHLDLIEAFVQSGLSGWKLVLVGEVDSHDRYCMNVLSSAERTAGVVITDFQSGNALQELYAHAGIFVLPSSHEGLPIAMLEALSYGLPVLASDIPANLEVGLPEEHYFTLGDTKALSQSLHRFAENHDHGEQRLKWRKWVGERYRWPLIAMQTYEVYKSAVADSHSSS